MQTKTSTVKLPIDLIAKLKQLKKSHQAIAGVIEDLITDANKGISLRPDTIKRLREYERFPDEPLNDVLNGVLDELDNLTGGKQGVTGT